ncbi:hypothetical protein [Pyrobaculum ferrireducens]|uniref:Uncharacterized protein n=1 Tax=Pyrobaculum ferrireducens TaxID=1104324 RepID=G7VC14_9CREN|nr:hypothetical protein [Pyrobaculum ferrireducens]AET32514.1 hypothetical protein P186_1078 [Pyrobaculum ferrireducens]
MSRGVLIYVLSAVALALGALSLISAVSAPSTDPLIFARDLSISLVALAVGAAAPLLLRKFNKEG